jgi:hypothetical protein
MMRLTSGLPGMSAEQVEIAGYTDEVKKEDAFLNSLG